jgi:hypothetical protein
VTRRRTAAVALALGILLGGLAGGGVTVEEQARPLPSGALPTVAATPTPSPTTKESTVYFVSGRGLEGVKEAVNDRSAEGILTALAAGPPLERQGDLRTLLLDPLTGERMLTVAAVSPDGQLVLARTDGFTLLPATDQILLVGQVVASMDEVGLTSVIITDPSGVPVPLVLPDGRVLEGPATAEDYTVLVID